MASGVLLIVEWTELILTTEEKPAAAAGIVTNSHQRRGVNISSVKYYHYVCNIISIQLALEI